MTSIYAGMTADAILQKSQGWITNQRMLFRPFRDKLVRLDEMVFQRNKRSVIAQWNPFKTIPQETEATSQLAQYKTPFVRKGCEVGASRMMRARPYFRTAVSDDDDQNEKSAWLSRYFQGILNQVDAREVQRSGFSWQWKTYLQMMQTGKNMARVEVSPDSRNSKSAQFNIDLVDPYNCYHSFEGHPRFFVHEDWVSYYEAREMAEENGYKWPDAPMKGGWNAELPTAFIDFWCQEKDEDGDADDGKNWAVWHGVLVGQSPDGNAYDVQTAPAMAVHEVEDVPRIPYVYVGVPASASTYRDMPGDPAGVSRGQYQSQGTTTSGPPMSSRLTPPARILYHASTWFEALEHTLREYQDFKTMEGHSLAKAVDPAIFVQTPAGQWSWNPAIFGTGAISDIPLGTIIKTLEYSFTSLDKASLIASCEKDMARAFAPALFGESDFAGQSGYNFYQHQDTADVLLAPWTMASARFIQECFVEATEQFIEQELTVSLRGRNVEGNTRGRLFMDNFNAGDMPDSWAVEVEIGSMLPRDLMHEAQVFQLMTQAHGMDVETGRSEILKIEDFRDVTDREIKYMNKMRPESVDAGLLTEQLQLRRVLELKKANQKLGSPEYMDLVSQLVPVNNTIARLQASATVPPETQPAKPGISPQVNPPANGPQPPAIMAGGSPSTGTGGQGSP